MPPRQPCCEPDKISVIRISSLAAPPPRSLSFSLRSRRGDALIAISTSGGSANVLKAAKKARELGLFTFGLLGRGGGSIKSACDLALVIEETDTPRIQEMHLLCAHIICELIEDSAAA